MKDTNSGKATNQYKGYPLVQTDKDTGSIMDTTRPAQAPYGGNGQIGPQSKTGWNTDTEKGK